MTTQDKLNLIREKCIAANPKRDWVGDDNGYPYQEPCRLADVLNVLRGGLTPHEFLDERYRQTVIVLIDLWNLLKDSLTDQSPETVEFIYSLLK